MNKSTFNEKLEKMQMHGELGQWDYIGHARVVDINKVMDSRDKALQEAEKEIDALDMIADTDKERELLSIKIKEILRRHFG